MDLLLPHMDVYHGYQIMYSVLFLYLCLLFLHSFKFQYNVGANKTFNAINKKNPTIKLSHITPAVVSITIGTSTVMLGKYRILFI